MVREIVFDTETTGLSPEEGDRLVEIGAVELINHMPTGVTFHQYINPEREVPEEAFKVHGLSYDYLKNFPTFKEIAKDWIDFVGDDGILVAHNASFDIKFINYQLGALSYPTYPWERVIDTLEIARKKFPGARVNLDAQLLAEVYLELLGGQEPSMSLDTAQASVHHDEAVDFSKLNKKFREPRNFPLSEEDLAAHEAFVAAKLGGDASVWKS